MAPASSPSPQSAPAASTRLERPACAWCASVRIRDWYSIDELGIGACQECGLVFATPREPAERARERYARQDYFETDKLLHYGYDDYGAHRAIHERVFAQALEHLERHRPQRGRLLDVGCALGYLLVVAEQRGWQPEGLDLSSWASERARELTGRPVHHGELTEVELPSASYDALTMFDVIEHVYDPRKVLHRCAQLLRPGGLLYLITPNVGGLQRRLMGKRWFHFKPIEHTYYFDKKSLGRFLEEAGLEPILTRRNLRWVTPRFVCERLQYYHRGIAAVLNALFGRWNWSAKLQLPLFTGEIEVIARRREAGEDSH